MAAMGRKRKDNPLGLPDRCYVKHGAFYYVTRDNKWVRLGTDLKAAIAESLRRNGGVNYGTMEWWYGEFLAHCKTRVGKSKAQRGISQRTHDDYTGAKVHLDAFFGDMTPVRIGPSTVGEFLQIEADAGRPVRANREKAALSACFTWLMLQSESGVTTNPCIGVRRNPESPRDRYVEDAEYQAVWGKASKSVRLMMGLVYRTLQRPEDVMNWSQANIATRDGQRVIQNRQGKTQHLVEIACSQEVEDLLATVGAEKGAKVVALKQPFVHRLDGFAYTYDGLCTNLQHAQEVVNKARKKAKQPKFPPFGFQDLKAKGATDMYQAGVPLESIRELCGHDSVTTTEIYVKRRLRKVVSPNAVPLSNIQ